MNPKMFAALAAGIVLLCLAIAVTGALISDSNARPNVILRELEAVLKAHQAYKADFGLYPPEMYPPGDPEQQLDYLAIHNLSLTPDDSFKPLIKTGYLKGIPPNIYESAKMPFPSVVVLAAVEPHAERFEQKVANLGVSLRWPEASVENNRAFDRFWKNQKHPAVVPYTLSIGFDKGIKAMAAPDAWFAPSNGMDSAGVLYMDTNGNQSPGM